MQTIKRSLTSALILLARGSINAAHHPNTVDVIAALHQLITNRRRPLLCGVSGFGGGSGCSLIWRSARV